MEAKLAGGLRFQAPGVADEAEQDGGYHYSTSQPNGKTPKWLAFGSTSGKVELKVVHGRTGGGLLYLNVYVKHLGRAGFAVGGLLGEDDHKDVMLPPASCTSTVALLGEQQSGQARSSASSVAMAAFEEQNNLGIDCAALGLSECESVPGCVSCMNTASGCSNSGGVCLAA